MRNNKTDLAIFLKAQRIGANMSQTELAKQLNCTPQFISNWENGLSRPTPKFSDKICSIVLKEDKLRISIFMQILRKSFLEYASEKFYQKHKFFKDKVI